jgi:hypothetical protein
MALSEVFLSMLVASGFAFLAGVLALLYKSKCISVKCCCMEIIRDVGGEEKLDATELGLQPPTLFKRDDFVSSSSV